MKTSRLSFAILAAALLAPAPAPAADVYAVDKVHSDVGFQIRHFVSKVRGRFTDYEGTIVADRTKPDASSVELTIKAASIDTGNENRDKDLRSANFFEVEKYPEITFKRSRITPRGGDGRPRPGGLPMRVRRAAAWLPMGALGAARSASAHGGYDAGGRVGALVSVSLEVDGRPTPLYPAPDGSGRYYLEAWRGARYALRIANRTGERLGVLLTVDGLNAISGERAPAGRAGGRMYVLYPWDETVVRGWRTSLEEVRQFTFVDEERSYAARSGKANARLGWIEVEVFRERRPVVRPWPYWPRPDDGRYGEDQREENRGEPDGKTKDEGASSARDGIAGRAPAPPATAAPASPGTGWGPRAEDPVRVVSFDPEPTPAERVTLRHEYASALRALGILPRQWWARDRLRERERGESGFARPPIY